MRNKILITILFFVLILTFILCNVASGYDIKITLIFENKSASDTDALWANYISKVLLKKRDIKEVFVHSYFNTCDIFLKLPVLIFNKQALYADVTSEVYSAINNLNFNKEYIRAVFDFDYKKKYNFLLAVNSNCDIFEFYNLIEDIFETKLFGKKIFDVKSIPDYPYSTNIYFSDTSLRQFKIDISKLKQIILNNNINRHVFISASIPVQINSSVNSSDDLENIVLPYKNGAFYTKFSNVFNIVNEVNYPQGTIISYNNSPGVLLGISSRVYIPDFAIKKILDKKLTNYKFFSQNDVIQTHKCSVISINPDNETVIEEILNKINSQLKDNNILCLHNVDISKFSKAKINPSGLSFFVQKKDVRKIKKFLHSSGLKQNKPKHIYEFSSDKIETLRAQSEKIQAKYNSFYVDYTKFSTLPFFQTDNYSLEEYSISKDELLYSLISANGGLIADYYSYNSNIIPIILKRKGEQAENFVYSVVNNVLYDVNNFVKTDVKEGLSEISRKNGRFYAQGVVYD